MVKSRSAQMLSIYRCQLILYHRQFQIVSSLKSFETFVDNKQQVAKMIEFLSLPRKQCIKVWLEKIQNTEKTVENMC